jgi:hypothetical protein
MDEPTNSSSADGARTDTIAGTGPGIPDDALGPGEEFPQPPSDEEVRRVAEKLGAPGAEQDSLPLEGE